MILAVLIIAGWAAASVVAALSIGPVLAHCSRVRDAQDREAEDHLAGLRDEETA